MDDFNIKDYLEGDLTDDGEINQQIEDLTVGNHHFTEEEAE